LGFGSGIYSARHHETLLRLAERLPQVEGKKAFIFSTYGAPTIAVTPEFVTKNHSLLRATLEARGFTIVDEFGCPGFNTNNFLKVFGGLNKGRPNADDLANARSFALGLKGGCESDGNIGSGKCQRTRVENDRGGTNSNKWEGF
jgi:hypothetical protein